MAILLNKGAPLCRGTPLFACSKDSVGAAAWC